MLELISFCEAPGNLEFSVMRTISLLHLARALPGQRTPLPFCWNKRGVIILSNGFSLTLWFGLNLLYGWLYGLVGLIKNKFAVFLYSLVWFGLMVYLASRFSFGFSFDFMV